MESPFGQLLLFLELLERIHRNLILLGLLVPAESLLEGVHTNDPSHFCRLDLAAHYTSRDYGDRMVGFIWMTL